MEMKYEDYGSLKPHNITGTYPKYVCDQCVDYLELRDPDWIKAQLDKAGSLINWVTDVLMIGEAFDGSAFIAWGTLYRQRRLPYIVKNEDGTYESKLSERTVPGHNFLMEAQRANECATFLRTCKEEPRNWLFIVSKEPDGFWARGATFATWYTRDPRFTVMHLKEEPDVSDTPVSGSVLLDGYRRELVKQRGIPPWMRDTIVIDSMVAADTVKALHDPEKVLDVRIPKFEEMASWTPEQRRVYSSYMMGHASLKQLKEVFP